MSLKILLALFFLITFIYFIFRPFNSNYAKLLLLVGSFFGAIFSYNTKLIASISGSLGLEKTMDLVVYIFGVLTFLFTIFVLDKFKKIDDSLNKIAKSKTYISKK